jgi:diguanylate cyclase (GGDEF)-like protein/PAS domain S-box-containing protein
MSTTAERPSHRPEPEGQPGPASDPFRQLAETAPVGMVHAATDGRGLFVNDRWREITGITTPTPIPFDVINEMVHVDDRDRVIGRYIECGRTLEPFETDFRLTRADGEVRHIRVQGTPLIVDGELAGFTGSTVDLTEVVEANQAREHSERRYRDLMARAPAGQTVHALDGRLVEINDAGAELLGYTPDELIGTQATDRLLPEERDLIFGPIARVIDGEIRSFTVEHRLIHRAGHHVWVSNNLTVERDADGAPANIHTVTVDISDRKAAEALLRASEERATAVIDSLHEGLAICTADGLTLVNRSACRILGMSADELLASTDGLGALPIIDSAGRPLDDGDRPGLATLRDGVPLHDLELGIVRPDGDTCWCLVNAVPLFDGQVDRPYAVALSFSDMTERKHSSDALRASESRFRTLTESLAVGVYQVDPSGHVTYANPQWGSIAGTATSSLTEAAAQVHPDDHDRVLAGVGRAFSTGQPYHDEYRIVDADGNVRWLSNRGKPTYDEAGRLTGMIGSVEDITDLLATQEQNTRLAQIIESTSDLVGISDAESGRLTYVNRSAREVFGLVGTDITEVSAYSLYSADSESVYQRSVLPTLLAGETWSGELTMIAAGGDEIVVWQSITPVMLADGRIHQTCTVGRDVTDQRRFEADLAYQATHDSLTGLPNRALLLDHLELALARSERDDRLIALLFLDLDRFKQVNDTLGHEVGDDLLAHAARLISAVVRPSDTVARLGGDEFVILCDDVDDEAHAVAVASRIRAAIETRPFLVGDTELPISASIGIALSSGGQAHPEALLRDADAAMYRAKDLGRARLEIYDESMRRHTTQRLELADQLAAGLEAGDIVVHFQPGVDLESGRVTCVEALARWNHPTLGQLGPDDFIGIAEDTGLIVGLGLRVLSTACEHGRRWETMFGEKAPRVHVNLSARQLAAPNLPVLVQGVLEGSGLRSSLLCLEITESVLMDDASAVIDTLWALKDLGVTLAIDDFGTGYSSLSYLRRFPVDVLKIDHSFVSGLGADPEDSTIVAAIISLAATLELEAIAEGVETVDQLERLRTLGCRFAQGFHFAQPGEPDDTTRMIADGFTI